MQKIIVIASRNPQKAAEIQRMVPKGIKVLCLKDIRKAANIPQAVENGSTFQKNAMIKAQYWAKILDMTVLAEDSGLVIDALDGYPGVYTKRCIEHLCPGADINVDNPAELYSALLKLMEESGNADTTAHWVSAMAFIDPAGRRTIIAEESLQGDMCPCAGERAFGFDQYFRPKGYNKTLSQLAPREKDKIGPRMRALKSILSQL